ncbi:aldehyde dehydrogenase family protein [Pseudonocardiaceae bacterium YIM PH 21723]|nr:aldehyde dehydrogenase family protein [Pseudonocardiaceae bacterium YIM PH 21723]
MSEKPLYSNFIDGRALGARDGATTDVVDPATGRVFATAPASGAVDVHNAVAAATHAFEGWRDSTPATRQRALLRIADALEDNLDRLVAAESWNTGKPLAPTRGIELEPAIDVLRYFAGATRAGESPAGGEYLPGHTSMTRRESIGVVAHLLPWRYPLMLLLRKVAPTLAAGNTVVLKPAESTPATAGMFAEIAAEFLPPGVVNVICGGSEVGGNLVDHDGVDLITVTGSIAAGREIARTAATRLKRTHMELGGKAPVVVFPDADLEAVADTLVMAAFFNAGQDCMAASRVLVQSSVYDRLVSLVLSRLERIHTGPPSDPSAFYGPLNSSAHLRRVAGFLERLPNHCALLTGGNQVGDQGYFFEPTVVSEVWQDDEIVQQEIFGPVLTVQRFTDEAGAVRMANNVPYGLAASVWTSDHARALRMSKYLETGCVWINTHAMLAAEMPIGGFKHSSTHQAGYGLDDYMQVKHVMSRME